jgi:tRNA(Glu) U13 pseudouridine synthase TruD
MEGKTIKIKGVDIMTYNTNKNNLKPGNLVNNDFIILSLENDPDCEQNEIGVNYYSVSGDVFEYAIFDTNDQNDTITIENVFLDESGRFNINPLQYYFNQNDWYSKQKYNEILTNIKKEHITQ